jgi:arsenate reductase (glutaredoxin)
LAVAEGEGIEVDVVQYLKTPPDRETLAAILAKLEDPVEDLVRKDAKFDKLGLSAGDYVGDADAVLDILVQHKELMQRPLLVRADKAIIGRPKDRVAPFLRGA